MRLVRHLAVAGLAVALLAAGCRPTTPPSTPAEWRAEGRVRTASDAARWLLAESLSPGGERAQAKAARARLDAFAEVDALGHLARGLDDAAHGAPAAAAHHFVAAAQAAQAEDSALSPLLAWYALRESAGLRMHAPDLWDRWGAWAESAIAAPGNLGWRARAVLVEWRTVEAERHAQSDAQARATEAYGCVSDVALAGPFGPPTTVALLRSHAPEAPAPWPATWPASDGQRVTPRQYPTKSFGCTVYVNEAAPGGAYYAQTFIESDTQQDVILAIQGAVAIWFDDRLVLERDVRQWGVWPRFGVALRVTPGRHRVLARLGSADTSVRVLGLDGTPAPVRGSADQRAPHGLVPPEILADPNVLSRYVVAGDAAPVADDVERFLAAALMQTEGAADVASVLIEPLIADAEQATGLALMAAARFVHEDPVFDAGKTEDLMRELFRRAAERDEELWEPILRDTLDAGARTGPADVVQPLEALAARFPDVPEVQLALAQTLVGLGWSPEYRTRTKALAERFPTVVAVLGAALLVYESEGDTARADDLLERIVALDPDTELLLERAVARRDWAGAERELKRLGARRPDREDLPERLAALLVASGDPSGVWARLEAAVARDPRSIGARLALADQALASGTVDALTRALADAVAAGAEPGPLEDALDLVEGATELEPYRVDARKVIADFDASGRTLEGTAARLLDYAVIWAHSDGSARMLEHEVVRIQSEEGIEQFAEQALPRGIVLSARVIKRDGRVMEPELVAGKPTVTLPHLEVGDHVETEFVMTLPGTGGRWWRSPRWFFREEKVAYARSEVVYITPEDKPLVFEVSGAVPPAEVTRRGPLVIHRFRVDDSPAAPQEPASPPMQEFLPSVMLGWGTDIADDLRDVAAVTAHTTPKDPRIVRIAQRIAEGAMADQQEQARRLYRWVADNVEPGEESDGRRTILGRRGSAPEAFRTLCDALGIEVTAVLAKSSVAPEPKSALSALAPYEIVLYRVTTDRGVDWVRFDGRYTPYGYIPPEARGSAAYLLDAEEVREVVIPEVNLFDGTTFDAAVELGVDGSAQVVLTWSFLGREAAAVRGQLARIAPAEERQAMEVVTSRVLANSRMTAYEIQGLDEPDEPLRLVLRAELLAFARIEGDALLITPPFTDPLSAWAALPARQTPLLVGLGGRRRVDVRVKLPAGYRVDAADLFDTKVQYRTITVEASNAAADGELVLHRDVLMEPDRIPPEEYAAFVGFARKADDASLGRIHVRRAP